MKNLFDFKKDFLKVQAGVRNRESGGRFSTFPFVVYAQPSGGGISYFVIVDTSFRAAGDNCIWRIGRARSIDQVVRFVGAKISGWLDNAADLYCVDPHVIRQTVVRLPAHGIVKRFVRNGEAPDVAEQLIAGTLPNGRTGVLKFANETVPYGPPPDRIFTQQQIGFQYIDRFCAKAA